MVPVPFYDIFWQQRKHQNRSTQFRGHNSWFNVSKIENQTNILGTLSKDTTADDCKQALEDIKAFTNFLLKKEQRLSEKSQTKLLTKIIPNMCIEVRQFSIPDGVNISEQKGNKGIEIKGNYTNIENLSD